MGSSIGLSPSRLSVSIQHIAMAKFLVATITLALFAAASAAPYFGMGGLFGGHSQSSHNVSPFGVTSHNSHAGPFGSHQSSSHQPFFNPLMGGLYGGLMGGLYSPYSMMGGFGLGGLYGGGLMGGLGYGGLMMG